MVPVFGAAVRLLLSAISSSVAQHCKLAWVATAILGGILAFSAPDRASAACSDVAGVTICSGDLSGGLLTGATNVRIENLSRDAGQIIVKGVGSSPGNATPPTITGYACSTQNDTDCVYGTSNGAPTCSPAANAPANTSCVAKYDAAASGPSGNAGPTVNVTVNSGVYLINGAGLGVAATSQGSNGGNGSDGFSIFSDPSPGGNGADGGTAVLSVAGRVTTSANNAFGIGAFSIGGNGGTGGTSWSILSGEGAPGGLGGYGGNATANLTSGSIQTGGNDAPGILVVSSGGNGGAGGGSTGLVYSGGGDGKDAGKGGNIYVVTNAGTSITTYGARAEGVRAQSFGGGGGSGAGSFGLIISSGGGSSTGGNGGAVDVKTNGTISTWGETSYGILAQSLGGNGGNTGLSIGIVAFGGSGGIGGNGGTVSFNNTGAIDTHGRSADAIIAQSIGGGGGNGGSSGGLVSFGGSGAGASVGGQVSVTNSGTLYTAGEFASGIKAQSIGGGGGNGGSSFGAFSFGGSGAAGANGALVTVTNAGSITTLGAHASAIIAQSIGGGGGNGGGAVAAGAFISVGLGGSGGMAGNGGNVFVKRDDASPAAATAYTIHTSGDFSTGVLAQSVGGGGGNGGFTSSSAAGPASLSVAAGGTGGGGGQAGTVSVETKGIITTDGANASGILAQSIGGGGGNGGAALSTSGGSAFAASVGLGGAGAGGGSASSASVSNLSNITTLGSNSTGITVQSIGGGGGNGGVSLTGSVALVSASVSLGGQGGAGGLGGLVTLASSGTLQTSGRNAIGMLAQSLGGGGGNGGFSGAFSIGTAGASIGLGGSGGIGQDAGNVEVRIDGGGQSIFYNARNWSLVTTGASSTGVSAQSIGGGGGNGGFAADVTLAATAAVSVGIGGSGGGGGDAGQVAVYSGNTTFAENILTTGARSTGILAQSIGGGGGDGGSTGSLTLSGEGGSVSVGLGGKGGAGGAGGLVTLASNGTVATLGDSSVAIAAQSIGGGGGNGGHAISLTATAGPFSAAVSLGGSGGSGSNASAVNLTSVGAVSTAGKQSVGLLAQSIGGGGGNGGYVINVSGSLGGGAATVGVGGTGGAGGNAGTVRIDNFGSVITGGAQSDAVLAQSIGGGGGNGGFSIGLSASSKFSAAVTVGGTGGVGGNGALVTLANTGSIATSGVQSNALVAQSIGGGGGNGGFAISGTLVIGTGGSVSVALGGSGGAGGIGGDVLLTSRFTTPASGNAATIETSGESANGIVAQSIGGGGGNGGFAGSASITVSSKLNMGLTIGGSGGTGNIAGTVTVQSGDNILTHANGSNGILAQSIGGGGGNGGFAAAGTLSLGAGNELALTAALGGSGSSGGNAGAVFVTTKGIVQTEGDHAAGIMAQSIGGGGGNGGLSVTGSFNFQASNNVPSMSASIGGTGGPGGTGGNVTIDANGTILTKGDSSYGILAQSIGGGGGDGGLAVSGSIGGASQKKIGLTLGGAGGVGSESGIVNVSNRASITTGAQVSQLVNYVQVNGTVGTVVQKNVTTRTGKDSVGILAQSIGGGGGNGGTAITAEIGKTGESMNLSVGVSIGGAGGSGGFSRAVNVDNFGLITTFGAGAHGIEAQSIGGGGGNGGGAVTGLLAAGKPTAGGRAVNVSIAVGGAGGSGNYAGAVTVNQFAAITTWGDSAKGIFAESIGGGGGSGGNSNTISLQLATGCTLAVQVKSCKEPKKGGVDMQVNVGGTGGSGNDGGAVSVTNAGLITTHGISSAGIAAYSIGAGGGDGGQATSGLSGLFEGSEYVDQGISYLTTPVDTAGGKESLGNVSVGGSGGAAGSASSVTVLNSGVIITSGASSQAILAQSIGGGGGNGGDASSGTGLVSVGGKGGAQGNGGLITITNAAGAGLSTSGDFSPAIKAQSIGGGGGDGLGDSSAPIAQSNGSGGSSEGIISIGGGGASAGNGGRVVITNAGLFSTAGAQSSGIFAQSIGGGGGTGGGTTQGGLNIGGSGGSAGLGGEVNISNSGVIVTGGIWSYGVFAQSVGGGGGAGGGSENSYNPGTGLKLVGAINIGGGGGSAGNGGLVTISNSGDITTSKLGASGVFAQSIGGGGGAGGGNELLSAIALGGAGGAAGNGGAVNVTNSGLLYTSGLYADGVRAQSIGGGGGVAGGNSSDFIAGGIINGSITSSAVGGNQAVGMGGAVTVTNSKLIVTLGSISNGIFAQSIGGGGGIGMLVNGNASVGGLAGAAGDAGSVTITNAAGGNIRTTGALANGIFAQSVGGGGGIARGLIENAQALLSQTTGSSFGGGGAGGVVSVTNYGLMQTDGFASQAIFAQSVGGGGGNAMAAGNYGPASASTGRVDVRVGSLGGIGGAGGSVIVENKVGANILAKGDSSIVINGQNSIGIVAQSVGGGGGIASSALNVANVSVSLGAAGANGAGGLVTVTNTGSIDIVGDNSVGIFAQSVGGGGGIVMPGGGVNSLTKTGGAGDASKVVVNNTAGFINVRGANSIGIMVQSVAGGGGAVGLKTDPPGQIGAFAFAGASGSGSGTSGETIINQTGSITATGENSIALVAQSQAPDGSGNITVNITNDPVTGAQSVITGGSLQGAGVLISGGNVNTLNNYGFITTISGDQGRAVVSTGVTTVLNNYGTIIGEVDLGSGGSTINNVPGKLLNSNASITLGTTGRLNNDGLVSPGAFENIMTTSISGGFTQSAAASYGVDVQMRDNSSDRINLTSTADVAGTIILNVMSPGEAQTGRHEKIIVQAAQGITGHAGLAIQAYPSAAVTYSLQYPNATDIVLRYDVNYSPVGLSRNQHAMGDAINALQTSRVSPNFIPLSAALYYYPTVAKLGALYDNLSGATGASSQQPVLSANARFASAISGQLARWTEPGMPALPQAPMAYAPAPDEGPIERALKTSAQALPFGPYLQTWASFSREGGDFSGNAEVGTAAIQQQGFSGSGGVHIVISDRLLVGIAASGSSTGWQVPDREAAGKTDAAHAAIYASMRSERAYVNLSVAGMFGGARYSRHAAISGFTPAPIGGVTIPAIGGFDERIKGSFQNWSVSGRIETGWHALQFASIHATPFAAVETTMLRQGGFEETQANGAPSVIGLSYHSRATWSLPVMAGLSLHHDLDLGTGAMLRTFARVGWMHDFLPERSARTSFLAAPGYDFVTKAPGIRDSLQVSAGLSLELSGRVGLFANFDGEFYQAGKRLSGTGGIRFAW